MNSLISVQGYEKSIVPPNFINFDREYHAIHRIDLRLGTNGKVKEFYAFDNNSNMINLNANECYFISMFADKQDFNYIYNHSNEATRKMLDIPTGYMSK
jgi:hypothetical protein